MSAINFADIEAKYGKALKHWVDYFSGPLKAWQAKVHGAKPSPGMIIAAVAMTSKHRAPGRECLSTAMQYRDEGCTVPQYQHVATIGFNTIVGPANNKRKAIVKAKHATETVTGKPYAFKLTPTASGAKFVLAVLDAVVAARTPDQPAKAAPAAKAKAAPKPKAAKPKAKAAAPVTAVVTAADNATAEPATVPATAEQPTSEALNALAQHFNQG